MKVKHNIHSFNQTDQSFAFSSTQIYRRQILTPYQKKIKTFGFT